MEQFAETLTASLCGLILPSGTVSEMAETGFGIDDEMMGTLLLYGTFKIIIVLHYTSGTTMKVSLRSTTTVRQLGTAGLE
jgi:hypothetical protein